MTSSRRAQPIDYDLSSQGNASVLLFVPGDRPDRFERAAAAGADDIIIDLEDAVSPERRPEARLHARAWLEAGRRAVVRVNAWGTSDCDEDLAALRGVASRVMLAKTETPEQVAAVDTAIGGGTQVIALIESARGILRAAETATASATTRLALGNVDLCAQLGIGATGRASLATARSMLVLASAAAGLMGPIDGVTTAIHDVDVIERDARHGTAEGFRGKLCVHPRQVPPSRAGLRPTLEEVSWAKEILAPSDPVSGGVRSRDGHMIDRPVELRAEDILRRQR